MRTRHAAKVKIKKSLLLQMLDFNGGNLRRVVDEYNILEPDCIVLVIEHPALPAVDEAEELPCVQPVYQTYWAKQGGIIKVERIEPPKTWHDEMPQRRQGL